MKKLLILVLVVMLLTITVGPAFADSDHAKHPEHRPGFEDNPGNGSIKNLPIPPGFAGADAPGPNNPND